MSIENNKILIAFSGGPDSVFLLFKILKIKKNFKKIALAHVNHGIRKDSDLDESFSRKIAKKHKLAFFSRKFDIPKISKNFKKSEEEISRKIRYDFFMEICENHDFDTILTAHNSTDNLETIILKIIRGSQNPNIGIKKNSFLFSKNKNLKINLFRPILKFSKPEILKFLKSKNIDFKIDKTNYNLKYTRNKIRHKIIPVLRELNPEIEKTSIKNTLISQKKEISKNEKLNLIIENSLKFQNPENPEVFKIEKFKSLSKILRREILHHILRNLKNPNSKIRISKEIILEIDKFLHTKKENSTKKLSPKISIKKFGKSFYFISNFL